MRSRHSGSGDPRPGVVSQRGILRGRVGRRRRQQEKRPPIATNDLRRDRPVYGGCRREGDPCGDLCGVGIQTGWNALRGRQHRPEKRCGSLHRKPDSAPRHCLQRRCKQARLSGLQILEHFWKDHGRENKGRGHRPCHVRKSREPRRQTGLDLYDSSTRRTHGRSDSWRFRDRAEPGRHQIGQNLPLRRREIVRGSSVLPGTNGSDNL
mmetsp:Transcript_103026/g.210066  ORF Transcript_103026/g.210066 Transcript_103026/m.210066 type:complete len:208 (+) Transcript_103026:383-1006(+)